MRCFHYSDIRAKLLNELESVDENILKLSDNKLINLLLYGDPQFNSNKNTRLMNVAIKYIIDSGRFTVPLLSYRNEFTPSFVLYIYIYIYIYVYIYIYICIHIYIYIYIYITQKRG